MQVTVQDGRVVRVQGDPEHPPTHGALCTKVSRYAERTYHPAARADAAAARGAEGERAVRAA
jgi:anaerobic selenocysteine-containing dehydrogenase